MDKSDPNTLLAGTWQVEQHTWAQLSGGPGSGVYITHDGGAKWTKVTTGMPKSPVGKIDVAIAPSNPQAHVRAHSDRRPGIGLALRRRRRDVEGRELGSLAHRPRRLLHPHGGQPAESGRRLHHRAAACTARRTAARTFSGNGGAIRVHAGTGELRRLPRHLDRSEGSRPLRLDGRRRREHQHATRERRACRCPNGQMYHVHVDNRVPYWIYSNRQDDGTMRGPIDGVGADRQRTAAGGQHDAGHCGSAAGPRWRWPAGGAAVRRRGAWRARRRARAGAAPAETLRPPGATAGAQWRAARSSAAGEAAATSCVAAEHRRLRVGLHDSRSDRREHRLRVAATATR